MAQEIALAARGAPIGTTADQTNLGHVADRIPNNARTNSTLSPDQKAAVIVRLLEAGPEELPLSTLNTAPLARLVRTMAGMSFVDEATTLATVKEFLAEFDSLALYFQPGIDGALATLDGHVDNDVTAYLSYQPDVEVVIDPWVLAKGLEPPAIAQLISAETPHVAAITLSKLSAGQAAEILAELLPDVADEILQAATTLGHVDAKTVAEIGASIAHAATQSANNGALPGDPIDRIGAMLNFTPGQTRDMLLKRLNNADADIADKIRKVMFTFADIPDRIEVKDVPKLARAVDADILVQALAAGQTSDNDSVEFILANLSKRLTEQLTEEIREVGEVKLKDADAAMNNVIQTIRDLEAQGDITLISLEE